MWRLCAKAGGAETAVSKRPVPTARQINKRCMGSSLDGGMRIGVLKPSA